MHEYFLLLAAVIILLYNNHTLTFKEIANVNHDKTVFSCIFYYGGQPCPSKQENYENPYIAIRTYIYIVSLALFQLILYLHWQYEVKILYLYNNVPVLCKTRPIYICT